MTAGKLPLTDIRTTVDDRGVRFDYGAGSALLRTPIDTAEARAAFDRHFRELPNRIARAGGRKLADGPAMRVLLPKAPGDYERPKAPVLGSGYCDGTATERTRAAIGSSIAGWTMTDTDGIVAIVDRAAPVDPARVLRLGTGPDKPIRFRFTPAFWRAYTRVRTCRPASGRITIDVVGDEVELWTADPSGDTAGCPEARERVPDCGADPSWRVALADGYVWPLRGLAGELRQGEAGAPVWIGGLDPRAIVLMPLAGGQS